MQLIGKVQQLLPVQTGTGKNGQWKKQEVIVATEGQYPRQVCVTVWGDKVNDQLLQPGNELKLEIDIESREYNGRWYTDIKAWKIELVREAVPGSTGLPVGDDEVTDKDDLPF